MFCARDNNVSEKKCFQGRYQDRNDVYYWIHLCISNWFFLIFPPFDIFLLHFKHFYPQSMSQASQVGLTIWSITDLPLKVSLTSFRRLRTSVGFVLDWWFCVTPSERATAWRTFVIDRRSDTGQWRNVMEDSARWQKFWKSSLNPIFQKPQTKVSQLWKYPDWAEKWKWQGTSSVANVIRGKWEIRDIVME